MNPSKPPAGFPTTRWSHEALRAEIAATLDGPSESEIRDLFDALGS